MQIIHLMQLNNHQPYQVVTTTMEQALATCRQLFQNNALDQAELEARRLLSQAPKTGEAWYYLGMIAHRRGNNAEALRLLATAANFSSDNPEIQNHFGNALRSHGHLDEATDRYEAAIRLNPHYASPFFNLGLVQSERGNTESAESFFMHALTIDPAFDSAHNSLGILRLKQGKPAEAIHFFREALQYEPNNVEALNNLAIALTRDKRPHEALSACMTAITIAPNCAELYNTQGIAFSDLGAWEQAVTCYEKALQLIPKYPEALNNLANVHRKQGDIVTAIKLLLRALELQPEYAVAWHNIGICYREQGELQQAVTAYQKSLHFHPKNALALYDLGNALIAQGLLDEAMQAYDAAIEAAPQLSIAHSNKLLAMNYSTACSADDIFQASLKFQDFFSSTSYINQPNKTRTGKIRVGYVSGDFRRHSVSYFLQSLFRHHNRDTFELICYSDVKNNDEYTVFFKQHADIWKTIVGLSNEQVAHTIAEDCVDILVDIAGHTSHRLEVFAHKPAPIQVTWLGYPGTTGLSSIDYRFTDEISDPPGESDRHHTETLIRLSSGFLCYTPPLHAPSISQPPQLETGRITFGSFNNISKITPETIAMWSTLLKRIPNAQLLLKSHALYDRETSNRYLKSFITQGVTPGRVVIKPWTQTTESHLAMYNEIDIALDTFPYNGTTTTCEALYMGVPVITLCGDRHASRVGASILHRVSLDALIATSQENYIEKAIALANDTARLTELRTTLRNRLLTSPLGDGATFTKNVEDAYLGMLKKAQNETL